MRTTQHNTILNKLNLLLMAGKGMNKIDCCIALNVEMLTVERYLMKLRKAGYKIRSTRRGLVITNLDEQEIKDGIKLIKKLTL